MNRVRGFTLIEVLIVLVIISVVATGVTLTVGHNRVWTQKAFVDEVSEVLSLAQEYAILQTATVRVIVNDNHIRFQKLQFDDKRPEGYWVQVDEPYLQALPIPSGLTVRLETQIPHSDEEKNDVAPFVVISMNGDWTPFSLWIGREGERALYHLTGVRGGALKVVNVDENDD